MCWSKMPGSLPGIRISMPIHHKMKGVQTVDHVSGCRDILRDGIDDKLWNIVDDGTNKNSLTLNHSSCRKPEQSFMECGTNADLYSYADRMIFAADVIAGLAGVIISEERYVGNWCITSPEDVKKHTRPGRAGVWLEEARPYTFRWYGIDNCPLMSPAMFYLVAGLFRQAVRIVELGLADGLPDAISREDVSRAMETSDKDLAWHLIQKVRQWITGPGKRSILYLPLSGGRWDVMEGIYRAACTGTLMESLGGSVEDNWGLREDSPYSDRSKDWRNITLRGSSWRKGLEKESEL